MNLKKNLWWNRINDKGYIYAIVTLILALLLLSLTYLYYESYKIGAETTSTKIRTDELHYLVESVKNDLSRAITISGRRGAIYTIDYVINGTPLDDSEETLKELILNGTITINGNIVDITYMENHTLYVWLDRITNSSEKLNFDTNITLSSMDIYPYDSWHFIEIITLNFDISDKEGMCQYKSNATIYSLVSIIDLEDPLYPLKTSNRVERFFSKNNRTGDIEILGKGIKGKGKGGGRVFDVSDGTSAEQSNNITEYNSTYPELVKYTVFVIDDFFSLSNNAKNVLNLSGGVIDYHDEDLDDQGFPYVSGLSILIEPIFLALTPPGWVMLGLPVDPTPSPMIFYPDENATYVALRNNGEHEILRLLINDDIENELYNSSENGSCFFDRLEGNLNLSEKYKNQSEYIKEILDLDPETEIGLESFVSVINFAEHDLYVPGILPPFINQSSVEYLYLQDVSGKGVYGTPEWFRLDDEHCKKYNLTEFCYGVIFTTDQGICQNAENGGLCDGLDIAFGVGYKAACCSEWSLCCT